MGQTLALIIILIAGLVATVAAFFSGWYAHKVHVMSPLEKAAHFNS